MMYFTCRLCYTYCVHIKYPFCHFGQHEWLERSYWAKSMIPMSGMSIKSLRVSFITDDPWHQRLIGRPDLPTLYLFYWIFHGVVDWIHLKQKSLKSRIWIVLDSGQHNCLGIQWMLFISISSRPRVFDSFQLGSCTKSFRCTFPPIRPSFSMLLCVSSTKYGLSLVMRRRHNSSWKC